MSHVTQHDTAHSRHVTQQTEHAHCRSGQGHASIVQRCSAGASGTQLRCMLKQELAASCCCGEALCLMLMEVHARMLKRTATTSPSTPQAFHRPMNNMQRLYPFHGRGVCLLMNPPPLTTNTHSEHPHKPPCDPAPPQTHAISTAPLLAHPAHPLLLT